MAHDGCRPHNSTHQIWSDSIFLFILCISEPTEHNQDDNEGCGSSGNDENYNQEQAADDVNMEEATARINTLIVQSDEDKENEKKQQKTSTTKKWYNGVVVKPVAFRSLARGNFSGH